MTVVLGGGGGGGGRDAAAAATRSMFDGARTSQIRRDDLVEGAARVDCAMAAEAAVSEPRRRPGLGELERGRAGSKQRRSVFVLGRVGRIALVPRASLS